MRTLGALIAVAVCTACPPPITWVPAEPTFAAPKAGFAVELPAGWTRLSNANRPDDLLITRDDTPLGRILVTSDEPGHGFILGDSKRVLAATMSPQEAAEAVVDGLESAGEGSLKVVENAPATLAGRKGFKVVASYKNSDGLRMGVAVYGVVIPTGVYYLVLQAPERVYFARHLPAFDKLAASFQLRPDAKGVKWPHEKEEKASEEKKPDAPNPDAPKPDAPAPSAYR